MMKHWKFLSKFRKNQGFSLLPLLCNIVLEVLATATRQENEIKCIQIGGEKKKRGKTVIICRWYSISYRNLYCLQENLLQLINEFSKVSGYKIKIQKSVAFLYVNNELSEIKGKN